MKFSLDLGIVLWLLKEKESIPTSCIDSAKKNGIWKNGVLTKSVFHNGEILWDKCKEILYDLNEEDSMYRV